MRASISTTALAPAARLPFQVTVLPTAVTMPAEELAPTSARSAGNVSVSSSPGLSICVPGPVFVIVIV